MHLFQLFWKFENINYFCCSDATGLLNIYLQCLGKMLRIIRLGPVRIESSRKDTGDE